MDPVALIAYFITIAIPIFTVYLFFALDVYATGKLSTILICLGWGASAAFFAAREFNNSVIEQGISFDVLARSIAPIIEELLKALILIILIQQPRFRYIVDGAVYGIAVGTGFALSENLFIYIPSAGADAIPVAISRTLSTALMHAAASGLVGISLGRLRRSTRSSKNIYPILGILLAIMLHVLYNNLAGELQESYPQVLLLAAIGIGVGSGALIAWQINQGLSDEKQRFSQTLGLGLDVSTGERKALQNLGGQGIEKVFDDLSDFFGNDNITQIRRMLGLQANIGILQNNINNTTVSNRLRENWEQEIKEYQAEVEQIRKQLGRTVAQFIQTLFPSDDTTMQNQLNEELAQHDPTLVHTFDMFMRTANLAEHFTPEELTERAERLNRIEIFNNVSLANLENLSRAIEAVTYAPGSTLFEKDDKGNAMFMIETGAIDIFVPGQAGSDVPLRTFEAGSVVGEFSLLDGRPRSATARAKGDLKVLMLQREVFNRFIQSRPKVVLAMLRYLAGKVRYTTDRVESTSTQPASSTPNEPLLAQIKDNYLLHGVPDADCDTLIKLMKQRSYEPGQYIFHQDDPGTSLFVILSGKVHILLRDHANPTADILLREFHPVRTLGELALLDEQPRSASALAVEHTDALELHRDDFLSFVDTRPIVGLLMMRDLVERVRYTTDHVQ